MRESPVQQRAMLEMANNGALVQRNNVGACMDSTDRLIRYGLMNDSKKLNEQFKSSDLIGIQPVLITSKMVGSWMGVYVAIECKHSDWNPLKTLDAHERAQAAYHDLVRRHGGRAGFATGVDDVRRILAGS